MSTSGKYRVMRMLVNCLTAFVLLWASVAPEAGRAQGSRIAEIGNAAAYTTWPADSPPVLDELPAITREQFLFIAGYAEPDAAVIIWYTGENGMERQTLPAIAADDGSGRGRFSLELELPEEGTYTIAASSKKGDVTSERSVPQTVRLDWTEPGNISGLTWELLAYNRIMLRWDPPSLESGEADPDAMHYIIYEEGSDEEIAETIEPFLVLEGLEESKLFAYRIVAADAAGNESSGEIIRPGTSPRTESKLAELNASADLSKLWTAISADGSTVAYTDTADADSNGMYLYVLDAETGEKESAAPTTDGNPPDGAIHSVRLSRTGTIVVFASDAANLVASPKDGGEHIYAYNRESGALMLISSPDDAATEPSVSADGRRIAYSENNRVYLYDRYSDMRRLISAAPDGPENGASGGAAISSNGSVVAFLSDSSNLDEAPGNDGEQAIYIYDTAEDSIAGRFAFDVRHGNLAVNSDGRYIVYTQSGGAGPGWLETPYFLDRVTGENVDLNSGRP